MNIAQYLSRETTINSEDNTITADQNVHLQNQTYYDGQNLYTSNQQTDDSFEMQILSNQHPENEWIKKEQNIVSYLKQLGLKMKTDPLEKQEHFYQKPMRRPNKSSTTQLTSTSQVDQSNLEDDKGNAILQKISIEMNSIKQRRTPNTTPQSSPLIINNLEQQEPIKKQRMSIFQKMQNQPQDVTPDEEEIENNIIRNQKCIEDQNNDLDKSDSSSSKSDTEQNYFQNLCG
ncbi:unnamed protein product (macronuclear) [Paramecium tetraurelia]|uniref:Uncharacterized protein n=1 Tax=Paramecium tetraurelia TaxID=5888 RepID=A0DQD7_PARTE|nr:uncharacterized protein GSPATT00002654001 [Paramecium tetraurelia]CAK85254.1 unnamed protein product [Paramecium tetraurelia]|eukprot:XP_001452651.1 hypothetical protein (macronuclear) [Paramecium tetraurelia strain d4-2]